MPEQIGKVLKFICENRWQSTEHTCAQLWEMLNHPASEELIAYVRQHAAFNDDIEWKKLADYICTPDDEHSPSHLILCFIFIANCGTGESAKNIEN